MPEPRRCWYPASDDRLRGLHSSRARVAEGCAFSTAPQGVVISAVGGSERRGGVSAPACGSACVRVVWGADPGQTLERRSTWEVGERPVDQTLQDDCHVLAPLD
jgi:hypothetical protein